MLLDIIHNIAVVVIRRNEAGPMWLVKVVRDAQEWRDIRMLQIQPNTNFAVESLEGDVRIWTLGFKMYNCTSCAAGALLAARTFTATFKKGNEYKVRWGKMKPIPPRPGENPLSLTLLSRHRHFPHERSCMPMFLRLVLSSSLLLGREIGPAQRA